MHHRPHGLSGVGEDADDVTSDCSGGSRDQDHGGELLLRMRATAPLDEYCADFAFLSVTIITTSAAVAG
jgi:hypothetical protein